MCRPNSQNVDRIPGKAIHSAASDPTQMDDQQNAGSNQKIVGRKQQQKGWSQCQQPITFGQWTNTFGSNWLEQNKLGTFLYTIHMNRAKSLFYFMDLLQCMVNLLNPSIFIYFF
jgi:hypothetical protein